MLGFLVESVLELVVEVFGEAVAGVMARRWWWLLIVIVVALVGYLVFSA